MKKIFQFGEHVDGYEIAVLNEREIRAAAGILFLFIYTALMYILFAGNFLLAKYSVLFFLIDFIIRVVINPRYSPSLIIGRLIVSNQHPEYVGAKQKKIAWTVGIALSGTMFVLMVAMNTYGPVTGIICLGCLIFLFFESVFGICLACKLYGAIYGKKAQYCPGEVCDISSRQPIQKTSGVQLLIVVLFLASVVLFAIFFNDVLSAKPHALFR
jgi:hypothetical protein